ncbi:hypothetical protein SORBI_3001G353250 [Sorghum bicolor]|uniref:Uncharacterized protein n=1 Tax=Sorghum bicolor TaxID=4558 RepID=A0A1Z5S980_SORBI|nr:hypothetical protein SORBI_3001G353250 [Sorghum bicolor]
MGGDHDGVGHERSAAAALLLLLSPPPPPPALPFPQATAAGRQATAQPAGEGGGDGTGRERCAVAALLLLPPSLPASLLPGRRRGEQQWRSMQAAAVRRRGRGRGSAGGVRRPPLSPSSFVRSPRMPPSTEAHEFLLSVKP